MQLQENISLKPYTTFGIDEKARYFSSFSTIEELRELLAYLRQKNIQEHMVLGGGSNILFTTGYEGCILKNNLKGIELVAEDDKHYYVKAQAGENWHGFVMHCIEHQYAGLENLSLIPGNTGASPMQNIGAYGVEIKDVFHELEALHTGDGTLHIFRSEDCAFGYRESVFKRKYRGAFIICSVSFRLNKQPVFHTSYGALEAELDKMGVLELSIKAISDAVIRIRNSKLPNPAEIGNAGSFFKNPVVPYWQYHALQQQHPGIPGYAAGPGLIKLAAGWLIEQCGWKGYREGDAGCFEKQALVLVNYGTAAGRDIWNLSCRIIESVQEKFGVELEREVNIV